MPHVHNGLHEYSRLLDAAARAIGEKSGAQDFTGIERFGETLTPIMDLWALPEWALLRGEILFSRFVTNGPSGAGVFSSAELVNPAGSGVLAVVAEIHNVGSTISLSVDSGVALGAVATARGLANDCRFPQLGEVSRCTLVTGSLVAGTTLPQDVGAATNDHLVRPYVIQPGKKLFIAALAANATCNLSLFWTERPLLPTEDRA